MAAGLLLGSRSAVVTAGLSLAALAGWVRDGGALKKQFRLDTYLAGLALAAIVTRTFPAWGGELQVLIVAMIAMHEMIGPIVFQWSLRRAGEVGAAARE